MKKNVMMRLASFLLVAVLISTSAISGTYAKYVTTATGTESARVAKWGVTVEVEGFKDADDGLFAKTYAKDSTTAFDNTVVSNEKVVAPGTKRDDFVTFTLKGEPEVAVDVKFKLDITSDVVLPMNTYVDYTTSVDGTYPNSFDVTGKDYHPIVFTLDGGSAPVTGTLADIKDYLENTLSKQYPAGTKLDEIAGGTSGEYTLSWAWDYGAFDGISENDKADTYLGNVAAGIVTDATAKTQIDFALTLTVTQID